MAGRNFAVPTGAHVRQANVLARPAMQLWERENVQRVPTPGPERTVEGCLLADEIKVPREHVAVMIGVMKRCTADPHRNSLLLNEFHHFMDKLAIENDEIRKRLFVAWNVTPKGTRGNRHPPPQIMHADMIRALCGGGVGSREAQTEALFALLDEDKNGVFNRAEFFQFVNLSCPMGLKLDKTMKAKFFSQITHLFQMLDDDGGGTVDMGELRAAYIGSDEVHQAFSDMNPFPQYFKTWNRADVSLSNFLRPLHEKKAKHEEREEQHAVTMDRLMQFSKYFKLDSNQRISCDDWDKLSVDMISARGEVNSSLLLHELYLLLTPILTLTST